MAGAAAVAAGDAAVAAGVGIHGCTAPERSPAQDDDTVAAAAAAVDMVILPEATPLAVAAVDTVKHLAVTLAAAAAGDGAAGGGTAAVRMGTLVAKA
jgi:hypothetical protein